MMAYRTTAVCAAALLMSSPAFAEIDINSYDLDRNRQLDRSEREAAKRELESMPGNDEAVHWLAQIEFRESQLNNPELVPVLEIAQNPFISSYDCDLAQELFIRASFSDISVLTCPELRPPSKGATVSFTSDNVADTNSLNIDGVIAHVLVPPNSLRGGNGNPDGPVLSDYALFMFAEAEGTVNFGTPNQGYSRFGLDSEATIFGGGLFELVRIDSALYYQSDLNFDAEGFGGSISVEPFNTDWNLNASARLQDDTSIFNWVAIGTLDATHIDAPGNTNLTADTNYTWVGGRVGAEYYVEPEGLPNGLTFHGYADFFWDLTNHQEARYFDTGITLNLNKDKTSALSFSYVNGEKSQDLSFDDQFKLNLSFKM